MAEPSPWRIPLADVRLPRAAVAAARATLESGWLAAGPRVEEFEAGFARLTGARHAVACSSGTAALQLALAALGVGRGGEVVLPSLTFVAAANVVLGAGAEPVFVDVSSDDDLTLDPDATLAALSPRTQAVMPMHYGGWATSPELLAELGTRGVPVVEDAAHAPGARVAAGALGALGAAGCFSFYANKNLPLGEGGMLVTGSAEVAEAARRLRSHGMTTGTWQRHGAAFSQYDVPEPGWNLRLDEPRAALGSALLARLEADNERRRRALADYRRLLARVPGTAMPFARDRPDGEVPAGHLAPVLLDPGIDRDAVLAGLAGRGIQAGVHYRPIHELGAYAGRGVRLPRTEALARRVLTLPLYPHLTAAQRREVVHALAEATTAV